MNKPDFFKTQEFSLVLGGPLFQLLRRSHLAGDGLELLLQRIFVISLLAWLPLLLLSALEGQMLGGGAAAANEPLVGSGDIQSLADLSNSFDVVRTMRAVPHHDAAGRTICDPYNARDRAGFCLRPGDEPDQWRSMGFDQRKLAEAGEWGSGEDGIHPFPGCNDLLPFDQQLGHRRPQPSNGNLNICFKRAHISP